MQLSCTTNSKQCMTVRSLLLQLAWACSILNVHEPEAKHIGLLISRASHHRIGMAVGNWRKVVAGHMAAVHREKRGCSSSIPRRC